MAISVVMPALEMAQETGKLLAWRKKEGDRVTKGEPLLEIETDKAVVEVEALSDGLLGGITAHEGDVIPVGQTIAWILGPNEKPPTETAPSAPAARATTAPRAPELYAAPAVGNSKQSAAVNVQVSPKARRLAKELGVDISGLQGTGPGGTITAEDVQASADGKGSSPAVASASNEAKPLSQIARLMAERTTQSWTSVPHFFVVREVDCSKLQEAQKKFTAEVEKARGVKSTITDLLVALLGKTLEKHPEINASWTGSSVHLNKDINVSVAMAVKGGVVGAVIHNANAEALGEISQQRHALTERARANRLRPADISGGTFTLSNLGMYQVDAFSAIITPPQAAILAVGGIADRVVPVDGRPAIRPMMTMTLSSDHRVVDGARAAQFMKDLVEAIQEPEKWLR